MKVISVSDKQKSETLTKLQLQQLPAHLASLKHVQISFEHF